MGVLGGTFDPIHLAHLRLAEEMADALGLAQVRLVPAARPPHRAQPAVPAEVRLAMCRLAAAGNPRLVVDARELDRVGASYTVDTLDALRRELGPRRPLVLIVGADAFRGLATWSRWERLFELAHLAVAHRAGADPRRDLPPPLDALWRERGAGGSADLAAAPAGRLLAAPFTPLEISSTAIRAQLAAGASPRYLLPDSVLEYIRRHQLYAGGE